MPTDKFEASRTELILFVPFEITVRPSPEVVTSDSTIEPALLKLTGLPPEESIVPPRVPMVNRRLVVPPLPVIFRIPPLRTRLAAEVSDGFPMLLLPSAMLLIARVVGSRTPGGMR